MLLTLTCLNLLYSTVNSGEHGESTDRLTRSTRQPRRVCVVNLGQGIVDNSLALLHGFHCKTQTENMQMEGKAKKL